MLTALVAVALLGLLSPSPASSFSLSPLSQQAKASLNKLSQRLAGGGAFGKGRRWAVGGERTRTRMDAGGDKTILWIRHGITEMNVFLGRNGYGSAGFVDPGFWDTKLTDNGERQARKLCEARQKGKLGEVDLIVSSPLSRALKTATIAFEGDPTPRIVNADLRERMWLSSDVGTPASSLKETFGGKGWDFSEVEDRWWYTDDGWGKDGTKDWRQPGKYLHPGEPEADFRERLERFVDWVDGRKERRIAVVCHWGVIHALTGRSLDNCEVVEGRLSEMRRHKMVFVD